MSRFNRSNLNHIKQICNEKAGVDLPEAKAPNNFKVIGVILAVLMVLTPLTVYGASYTLSALEYRDSVKKLGVEVDTFVSDFVGSIYGDSDVYVVSDGSDTSLHELIRMSVIGFKEALDPNDWDSPSIETVSMGTKNDGTTWYTFVRARIDEYPDSDSGEEYDIYFYLKYEGSAEYFVLTDMYFYSGVNVSKNIFGDIGALGNTLGLEHFAAWAENTNDFSEYISNAREFYSEYMEYLEAEAFAKDFMRDYISYVYEDGNPWEDKEGQIYTLLDYAKYVLNYINPSVGGFGVKDSVPMYTTEKLILKDGAWYYRGMIGGVLLSSENERINDFLGYMYLKLNRIEDTFEVEDFFLSDPVNFSHHFYEAEYEIKLMDMDEFIAWAELTNDYSRFIQNGKASLDSYIRKNVIDSAAMDFSDTFVNAAFLGGEKAWNVSAEGSLDKFISYFADYLLLSTNNGNVDRYTYEIKKSVGIGQDDGYYTSLLVNITEHRNDGTEVKYRTKIFLKLVLECKTAVVTDFYYNGDLPQCSEIFEKVGTNHFSLTDATFRAWAEETNDYSVYSQKALTAISELQ